MLWIFAVLMVTAKQNPQNESITMLARVILNVSTFQWMLTVSGTESVEHNVYVYNIVSK